MSGDLVNLFQETRLPAHRKLSPDYKDYPFVTCQNGEPTVHCWFGGRKENGCRESCINRVSSEDIRVNLQTVFAVFHASVKGVWMHAIGWINLNLFC